MPRSPAPPRRRPRGLAAALAVLAGLVAGCPAEQPAAPSAATSAAPRPRIVTPAPALAEIVCALGAEAHLVGVSRYCTHPPSLERLPRIGGIIDPNLEAVDALAPDLILLQGADERLDELAQRRGFALERFRIETVAEALAAIERVGRLLDRPGAAAAEVARLRTALAPRPAPGGRPPRTLLVFGHRPGELGELSVPGSGTFLAECLVAAGGASCVADLPPGAWHVLAREAVLAEAPELIIELVPEDAPDDTVATLRADWQEMPTLPAVRDGRVAVVCGSELLIPGPRLDRVVDKLARAIAGEPVVR